MENIYLCPHCELVTEMEELQYFEFTNVTTKEDLTVVIGECRSCGSWSVIESHTYIAVKVDRNETRH